MRTKGSAAFYEAAVFPNGRPYQQFMPVLNGPVRVPEATSAPTPKKRKFYRDMILAEYDQSKSSSSGNHR